MSTPKYTAFHRNRLGGLLFPSEFLIRTMLGSYRNLTLSRDYEGKRLLDLGFGDGRNLPLLCGLGAEVYGVEPDQEVCSMVSARATAEGLRCDLRPGSNAKIPFDDAFFDYIVASHSIYYIEPNTTFETNLREARRALKPGGYLIATLPDTENFILKDAIALEDGHYRITADPFGLRNGTIFRAFGSRENVVTTFSSLFCDCSIATFRDDWFGLLVSGFVVVCRKPEEHAD